jgi:hypothetical protein
VDNARIGVGVLSVCVGSPRIGMGAVSVRVGGPRVYVGDQGIGVGRMAISVSNAGFCIDCFRLGKSGFGLRCFCGGFRSRPSCFKQFEAFASVHAFLLPAPLLKPEKMVAADDETSRKQQAC